MFQGCLPHLHLVELHTYLTSGVAGSDAAEERATRAQQDACMQACQGAGLVVFNMFALEGYHVADKMQVSTQRRLLDTGLTRALYAFLLSLPRYSKHLGLLRASLSSPRTKGTLDMLYSLST